MAMAKIVDETGAVLLYERIQEKIKEGIKKV